MARMLHVTDFWDIPLSGLCLFKGNKCWFKLLDQEATVPLYNIYHLSEKDIETIEYWRQLFNEKVSTQWDYDVPEKQRKVKSIDAHNLFYDKYKNRKKKDYTSNKLIGTVTLIEFRE